MKEDHDTAERVQRLTSRLKVVELKLDSKRTSPDVKFVLESERTKINRFLFDLRRAVDNPDCARALMSLSELCDPDSRNQSESATRKRRPRPGANLAVLEDGTFDGSGYIPTEEDHIPEVLRNFRMEDSLGGMDSYSSYNVPLDGPRTVFDEIYIENAKRACSKCVGHCCRAFQSNSLRLGGMADQIENARKAVNRSARIIKTVISMKRQMDPEIHEEILREEKDVQENAQDELYTYEFFSKRLVQADNMKFAPEYSSPNWFKCLAFDEKAGRCTEYDRRPSMCRRFICGPATAGHVPPFTSMMFGRIQTNKQNLKNAKRKT